MPLVSQAFEKNQSNDYQAICSSNGLKLIEINDQNLINNEDKPNISHCINCIILSDNEALVEKIGRFQKLSIFSTNNKVTSFLISNKKNILENNHSQAPPSI
tara:strand:- start:949 stop:1254 length:306 start_codon:yes stop_codon:yes gene_type:complete